MRARARPVCRLAIAWKAGQVGRLVAARRSVQAATVVHKTDWTFLVFVVPLDVRRWVKRGDLALEYELAYGACVPLQVRVPVGALRVSQRSCARRLSRRSNRFEKLKGPSNASSWQILGMASLAMASTHSPHGCRVRSSMGGPLLDWLPMSGVGVFQVSRWSASAAHRRINTRHVAWRTVPRACSQPEPKWQKRRNLRRSEAAAAERAGGPL